MDDAIFDLTADQLQFRDVIEAFLRKAYGDDARRKIVASKEGLCLALWRQTAADIGLMGLGFTEANGGYGGRAVDLIPVMEALGRALVVEPFLETVVLAGSLLQRSDSAAAAGLIEEIIAGEVLLAVAHLEPGTRFQAARVDTVAEPLGPAGWRLTGRKTAVMAAPWAHQTLVVARTPDHGLGIFIVPATSPGLMRRDYSTLDGRRASDIDLDGVVVESDAALLLGPAAEGALEAAFAHATVAICAEATGIMRRLLADTSAHLEERKQFGVPLASFQVLQHRTADMLVALELSAAHVHRAADALDRDAPDKALAVSAAKAFVGRAVHRVAQAAVQMHGGMGVTDELAIGHLFKRGIAIEAQYGSTEHHVRRFQALRARASG